MQNRFHQLIEQCKQDSKALQNIDSAIKAFLSLEKIFQQAAEAKDEKESFLLSELASDTFYAAVIKYCKPFTQSNQKGKTVEYSSKRVKKYLDSYSEFSDMHVHLLDLRNKLIGHDDYDMIEPKILTLSITPRHENGDPDGSIPISITTINKCLAHPLVIQSVEKMRLHAQKVHKAILKSLSQTLSELQQRALKYPEEGKELLAYQENLGTHRSDPETGATHSPPEYSDIYWFQLRNPVEGYHYHTYKFEMNFYDQEVDLPSGNKFVIKSPEQA